MHRKRLFLLQLAEDVETLIPDEHFDMTNWYGREFPDYDYFVSPTTFHSVREAEEKLKTCGYVACFVGYTPLLPSARAEADRINMQFVVDPDGVRLVNEIGEEFALHRLLEPLLGISYSEAVWLSGFAANTDAYGKKEMHEITKHDVARLLRKLAVGEPLVEEEGA